jgi:hypothetical protein
MNYVSRNLHNSEGREAINKKHAFTEVLVCAKIGGDRSGDGWGQGPFEKRCMGFDLKNIKETAFHGAGGRAV